MHKTRRRIVGIVSQIKLPFWPTTMAAVCAGAALTRAIYATVVGDVPGPLALAIGATPSVALIAAVMLWGGRESDVEVNRPYQPRRAWISQTGADMRNNLGGTYLNGNGTPCTPATGDGASRTRTPIPGRELRYLPGHEEDAAITAFAATLPCYRRWATADQKVPA